MIEHQILDVEAERLEKAASVEELSDAAVDAIFEIVVEYRDAVRAGQTQAAEFEGELRHSVLDAVAQTHGESARLYLVGRLRDVAVLGGRCNVEF